MLNDDDDEEKEKEKDQIRILNKTSVIVSHHTNTGFDEYKEPMNLFDDEDLEDSGSDLINK